MRHDAHCKAFHTELLGVLPHQAGRIHVELDACFVAAVEEDGPSTFPPAVVYKVALRECRRVGVKMEVVQDLREERDAAVGRPRISSGVDGACFVRRVVALGFNADSALDEAPCCRITHNQQQSQPS